MNHPAQVNNMDKLRSSIFGANVEKGLGDRETRGLK